MISVIGLKRLTILLLFLTVNVVLGAAIHLYVLPELNDSESNERRVRSQVNRVRSDIDRLQLEFEQLDQQQDRFNALKEKGFFSIQTRSDAKALFSRLQNRSKVVSAVVSVKPGVVIDDQEAQKARHKVLASAITIDIEAFDDVDVYRYIDLLNKEFPGHITIDHLEMKRTRDVNAAVLRAISSGANPVMVKANLKLSWRTMVSEDDLTGGVQ